MKCGSCSDRRKRPSNHVPILDAARPVPGHGGRRNGSTGRRGVRRDAAMLKKHRLPRGRPHRGDRHRGVRARAIRRVAAGSAAPSSSNCATSSTAGFEDAFTADPRHPIAAVRVESAQAVDGADRGARPADAQSADAAARAQRPQRDLRRGRSRRCRTGGDSGAINLAGPSTAIRDVRVAQRGNATAVTLLGTARLVTTSIQEPKDGTPRLVLDMPNVTSALPGVDPDQAGTGRSRAHRREPEVAAADAGRRGPVACGAVSRGIVTGWQRPDAGVR